MAYLLDEYLNFLSCVREKGYKIGPVRSYFEGRTPPFIFCRHDVDRRVDRSFQMAMAEKELGVISTYYFRCEMGEVFPEEVIRKVASAGHEVGYHYEVISREGGDNVQAKERFKKELKALRNIVRVQTVAAHGKPLSRHSNMSNLRNIDFSGLDLLGDSSMDINFSSVLYVTDTGGTFGSKYNLRDYICGKQIREPMTPQQLAHKLDPNLEKMVLVNTHPERWPKRRSCLLSVKSMDWIVNIGKLVCKRWHARQDNNC